MNNSFEMDWKGSTVVVTWGAGFIGSHLVDHMLDLDCEVVLAAYFSRGSIDSFEHCLAEVQVAPVDLTK